MKFLFESLLRLYEFDGPAQPESKSKHAMEARLLDPSAEDGSTFPYLP